MNSATDSSLLLDELREPSEETKIGDTPRCDCHHERLTDGVHHYLDLPGEETASGLPSVNESLEHGDGYYIAIAFVNARACFLRPTWAASFRGPSEAGEIPPSLRLLCDWCKGHWSNSPVVNFERIS